MKVLPEVAGSLAQSVDDVSIFVTWVCMISFVIVMGMVIVFPIIYKRKSDDDETPDIRGNHMAEAIWTIIPTILSVIIFMYGLVVYNDLRAIPEGDDVMEVKVTGRMWQWIFTYDDGRTSLGELIVPVDTDIRLLMKSEDVIHSFFVPAFRIKQDVLPTMFTKLWFNATKEGDFQIFCTEYCGKDHSAMLAKVKVLPQDEYDEWWNASAAGGEDDRDPVVVGEEAYTKFGCNACHSTDGVAGVGPSFKNLFGKTEKLVDGTEVVVDENYIVESIYEPTVKVVEGYGPIMPAFKGLVNESDMNGLVAYIKSLQ